jgi:HD-GYP domain-containing protein (c-di-GMP phosphodiesterase class II)
VLAYMEDRAGTEFDGELVRAFVKMMSEWEPKLASMEAPADAAATPVSESALARPSQG